MCIKRVNKNLRFGTKQLGKGLQTRVGFILLCFHLTLALNHSIHLHLQGCIAALRPCNVASISFCSDFCLANSTFTNASAGSSQQSILIESSSGCSTILLGKGGKEKNSCRSSTRGCLGGSNCLRIFVEIYYVHNSSDLSKQPRQISLCVSS